MKLPKVIKIPIFKIPLTRPRPKVEHTINQEFQRERTLKTLENIKNYLQVELEYAPEFSRGKTEALLEEVTRLMEYLSSHK